MGREGGANCVDTDAPTEAPFDKSMDLADRQAVGFVVKDRPDSPNDLALRMADGSDAT